MAGICKSKKSSCFIRRSQVQHSWSRFPFCFACLYVPASECPSSLFYHLQEEYKKISSMTIDMYYIYSISQQARKKKSKKYIFFFTQLWLDLQRVNCCEAALSAMWGLSEPRECICHPCTASHLPALHPGGLWACSSLQPVPLLCLKRNTKAAWKMDAVPIPQPSWKGWLPWSLPCSMDQFC